MGRIFEKRTWLALAICIFGVHTAVSALARDGYALTLFADITQTALQLVIAFLAARNMIRSRGQIRAFWALMTIGFVAWSVAQCMWAWFEIVLRRPVPEPFAGDVVLFLHVVPLMAALVMRPHRGGGISKLYLATIDFVLLLLWWMFLFVFVIIPWQLHYDRAQYSISFNLLYLAENVVWLAGLALLCKRTRGQWRSLYGGLFVGGLVYLLSSHFINSAILAGKYYTGSLYDLPLVCSMLWFSGVIGAAHCEDEDLEVTSGDESEIDAHISRVAMLAILSMPAMAAWSAFFTKVPKSVADFRLAVSLAAMFLISVVLFAKQYLMDRERMRLLDASQESYAKLKRLQTQLVQSEKLAALGQLVSGAAHEINNPLTAILGYSELIIADTPAENSAHSHARKIKQQVTRTKDLVLNLLRFARNSDSAKKLVDINSTISDSLHLRELEVEQQKIRIECELAKNVPPIWADQTQMLDLCFQLIGNALDAVRGQKNGSVSVQTAFDVDTLTIEVVDNGPGITDPNRVFDPFYTTKSLGKGPGLGLSACYGIVSEHGGQISCENRGAGGAQFTVRLPLATRANPAGVRLASKPRPVDVSA